MVSLDISVCIRGAIVGVSCLAQDEGNVLVVQLALWGRFGA